MAKITYFLACMWSSENKEELKVVTYLEIKLVRNISK
jgi:hypothetical protein